MVATERGIYVTSGAYSIANESGLAAYVSLNTAGYALSVATNGVTTGIIAWKAWKDLTP
jgi:hypothetical protein